MKDVAKRAGFSESLISQIERNKVSPSIDTLLTIAGILEIDLDYLFRDYRQTKKAELISKKNRYCITTRGVTYTQLSVMPGLSEEHSIEAFLMEIKPGKEKGSKDFGHSGKELGYILEGKGELEYGTEIYKLTKGDCISFASDIPHILKNTGTKELKAMWVITPPKMFFFKE